jgi:hypothetical protein
MTIVDLGFDSHGELGFDSRGHNREQHEHQGGRVRGPTHKNMYWWTEGKGKYV